MKQWFATRELVGVPGLPSTRQAVNRVARRHGWRSRAVRSNGGERMEYHLTSLPAPTQAALMKRELAASADERPVRRDHAGCRQGIEAAHKDADAEPQIYDREALWRWAETRPEKLRAIGRAHAALLSQAMALQAMGHTLGAALQAVGAAHDINPQNLRNWYYGTSAAASARLGARCYAEQDWPALLTPGWCGQRARTECAPEAWDVFKALYLTRRAPTLAICYERTTKIARRKGWAWPCRRTIERRVKRDLAPQVRVLLREGPDALERMMPAMERDRSHFSALEAVNGDGIKWARWCLWPDGEVARPCTWITQDLYSNRVLAWATDRSENKDMFRLAYGDLVERWGIPRLYFLDNTMAAANKWMTGGTKNRYRWKIRDDDPLGIMPQMGTTVRFVTPAHGQSKPVERANREYRERVDTHPAFEGRGTEQRPIPIAEFEAVLAGEFAAYNAREGRQTRNAAGRSFEVTFAASYATATVRKATAEQRRLWLLAAERVYVQRDTGSIVLGRGPQGENRYWSEALARHAGTHVIVRFDPRALGAPVHVYEMNGVYIGAAACNWRGGFDDAAQARVYLRERARFRKATKKAAAAEQRMTTAAAAALMETPAPTPTPTAKVIELARMPAPERAAARLPVRCKQTGGAEEQDDADFVATVKQLRAGWERPL